MKGIKCGCGYEFPMTKEIETDKSDLVKLQKKSNQVWTMERKGEFYSELVHYAQTRGYKTGWAKHKYRSKFGVWPNKVDYKPVSGISDEVMNFIKSQNIANAYKNAKMSSKSVDRVSGF
jgi:hypothetical protein